MITKVYDKTKQILKNNYKFFLVLITLFMLFTIELPYYIDAPGGLIDVSKRIEIEDSYKVDGTLNLAYVLELKATVPTLIYAYFNDDWDIYKKEEIIASNETVLENNYRDHLMLEEANQNALYVGFSKALERVEIENEKVFVSYIDEQAKTDLKIGDEIISINGNFVHNKNDVYQELKKYSENDTLKIIVKKDNQTIEKQAQFIKSNDRLIIGMVLVETKDIKTDRNINLNFKSSESGPSGGFMMSLAIYNYLTEKDITHGLNIVGTGTIDMDGNVGVIGGVGYKIKAAVKKKADIFFVPEANYEEALEVVKNKKYDIKLVMVRNIDDAINYLNNL